MTTSSTVLTLGRRRVLSAGIDLNGDDGVDEVLGLRIVERHRRVAMQPEYLSKCIAAGAGAGSHGER